MDFKYLPYIIINIYKYLDTKDINELHNTNNCLKKSIQKNKKWIIGKLLLNEYKYKIKLFDNSVCVYNDKKCYSMSCRSFDTQKWLMFFKQL